MRRAWLVVVGLLAASSVAQAQGWGGRGERGGPCGPGGRQFDAAAVTTLSGTIDAVDAPEAGARGRHGQGVHLVLATSSGKVEVRLGPSWYLEQQDVKLAKGDAVEVTGAPARCGRDSGLVALSVKKGGASLILRDADGLPLWAGMRRR